MHLSSASFSPQKYHCVFVHSSAVTVEFDPTSYTVSESGRFANITVVKRRQTSLAVSVEFSTADSTAIGESLSNFHWRYYIRIFYLINLSPFILQLERTTQQLHGQ